MSRTALLCSGVCALGLTLAVACGDDDETGNANVNDNNNQNGNGNGNGDQDPNDLASLRQVLETNADIAFAAYSDAVDTAESMKTAIDAFVADPTGANLTAAKNAWLVAREPYGQTEVYRFRASPIDDTDYDPSNGEDGPEGNINAWPLGEALIDYVVTGDDFGQDQVGVSEQSVGIDPTTETIISSDVAINAALLANTASAEDERDVIAGYHAIEFLLWGQDVNADGSADAPRDNTPGQRPATDFSLTACTNGAGNPAADNTPCQRRQTYLQIAAQELIDNLTDVRDAWADGASYRTAFTSVSTLGEAKGKLLEILVGMGTLSEGELAGERMQIALSANSQEDEHSCFADNTHRDILLNHLGIANSFFGDYAGYDSTLDGTVDETTRAVNGYGIDDYLEDLGLTSLASAVASALNTSTTNATAIDTLARSGTPVDLQIVDASSADAQPMRDTIVSLNAQSAQIANIAIELDVGSADDVVDPDASECDTTDPTAECG